MPSSVLSHLSARATLALLTVPPALAIAALVGVVFLAPSRPATDQPMLAATPRAVGQVGAAAAGQADAGATSSLPPTGGLLVEVSGAVAHPGLYRVVKGERVSAAITAAGGLAPDADPDRLPDMAARLKDGQQVKVPSLATTSRTSTRASTATSGALRVTPVSLNAATADQLAAIPGFTPELAVAVIDYRTQFGGFASTRELVDVLNMGETDYQLARPYLRI